MVIILLGLKILFLTCFYIFSFIGFSDKVVNVSPVRLDYGLSWVAKAFYL
jgi:hypothetical protein